MTGWRNWLIAASLVLAAPRVGLPQEPEPSATNTALVQQTASAPKTAAGAPTKTSEKDKSKGEKSGKRPAQVTQSEYVRPAVQAIAFLLAFLTVVGVWKIPPSQTRLTSPQGSDVAPQKADAKGDSGTSGKDVSPFASNFARTVIAGLGGIAGIGILGDIFKVEDGFNVKAYYLCWFVAFFFPLLLLSSLLRAWTETLRSRIAAGERPGKEGADKAIGTRKGNPVRSLLHKLRGAARAKKGRPDRDENKKAELDGQHEEATTAESEPRERQKQRRRRSRLIFLDTLFNALQGNNQLQTAVLGDTILDLQRSLLSAADRARTSIQRSVRDALQDRKKEVAELDVHEPKGTRLGELKGLDIDDQSVRVGISVLSSNQASLSYIVSGPGSLPHYFDRHSVAWVSVCSGQARWWKHCYEKHKSEIELFDNTDGSLPVEKKKLMLGPYFQERAADYEAFLVLPVPWFRRSEVRYRKAGIHLSFSREILFDALIDGRLEDDAVPAAHASYEPKHPLYKSWKTLLGHDDANQDSIRIKDPTLRAVLLQAIDLLSELLRHYNEEVLQLGGPGAKGG